MAFRILLACLLVISFFNEAYAEDRYEWSARIVVEPSSLVSDGFDLSESHFTITVTNTGEQSWESDKIKPQLSYHLEDESGRQLRFDNRRFDALNNKPGQKAVVRFTVPADVPAHAGKLVLKLDIVREGVAWFGSVNKDNRFPSVTLEYKPISIEQLRQKPALAAAKRLTTGDKNVDLATSLAFYTLIKAQSKIITATGEYTVLNAGSGYPQAWIRDCATGIDAAFLVLGDATAKGCILMHLQRQHEDGYVNDWVNAKNEVDKNTVETDQESSLVVAAAEYVDRSRNRAFLLQRIGDATVLEHLRKALEFVWTQKRDPSSQLVVSGHTIDWGDVSIEEADQKAIYLSPRSHLVTGIYNNAIYVLAIRDYLHLLSLAPRGYEKELQLWKERQTLLKTAINSRLWNVDKGWYVTHRHVAPFNLNVDEDAMFPMGGNVFAIEAGISDSKQANSIYDNALRLQKQYGAATISGVLYPAYPAGIYPHPAVNQEYSYQNGGLWDWFGLRLVRTMYASGRTEDARKALAEIAAKVLRNKTFSEWDHSNGEPAGSREYLGAAGPYISVVEAIHANLANNHRTIN